MTQAGILSGKRVVEAAAFVAAPLGGGLDYRRWPVTKDNTSMFWCGLNRSK